LVGEIHVWSVSFWQEISGQKNQLGSEDCESRVSGRSGIAALTG
jgi:hypothetical protein